MNGSMADARQWRLSSQLFVASDNPLFVPSRFPGPGRPVCGLYLGKAFAISELSSIDIKIQRT